VEFEATLRELQRVQQRIIVADRREPSLARSFPISATSRCSSSCSSNHVRPRSWSTWRKRSRLTRLSSEQEICKIHQIIEINEIFRDLARLVQGQHEAIEVKCNLGATATEVAQAEAQLTEATTTQGRKTRSEIDYTVIAAVALVVLILVLLYFL
jgi:hypothetical protein